MKLGLVMLVGSVLSAFGIVALLGAEAEPDVRLAVWLGMAGPLVVAVGSAIAIERVFRKRPESSTKFMAAAFAAKMILFGGYVALVVAMGWARPTPFAIAFVAYFLVLQITEAFYLKHLFATALKT